MDIEFYKRQGRMEQPWQQKLYGWCTTNDVTEVRPANDDNYWVLTIPKYGGRSRLVHLIYIGPNIRAEPVTFYKNGSFPIDTKWEGAKLFTEPELPKVLSSLK